MVSSSDSVGAGRHTEDGFSPHLFVGDGDESVLGELPHHVQVRPHVQLAADQHHFGTGTELLRLTLPL